ncbi:MAG: nitrogen fixation protein NifH [Anaerolineales bacterium]|nr:nitrogen fixation protein NifH [Anaerolineales bacterium]
MNVNWQKHLEGQRISWLLEMDNPGVRYLALRDLLNLRGENAELIAAREKAFKDGPISLILDAMNQAGYWVEPGAGYNPKYQGTVWAMILLGQLGASVEMDVRIERACRYLLENALAEHGQFTTNGAPSGTADCLQGNLCAALLDLGVSDPRLDKAFEWMARSVTGEGIAPMGDKMASLRYYAGKCGPVFACGANNKLPCAWGGVKVMLAFGKLSLDRRTPLIQCAIEKGVEFLFSVDPAEATYPTGWTAKPSGNWWKFGFPVFYVTDLLQNVEALVRLGYGDDPRLSHALRLICEKQDANGRWALEYDYTGKTWGEFGKKKQPNKWVTLRAAWVLKHSDPNSILEKEML